MVVVGSGAGGLTAAYTAAKGAGLNVLVAEKTQYYGGTSAYSGGSLWLPCNKHQEALGVEVDSGEDARTYLKHILGERLYELDRINAYISSSREMVGWLEKHSKVRFGAVAYPDYYMGQVEGAKYGRTIGSIAFDGRQLGHKLLREVRLTLLEVPLRTPSAHRELSSPSSSKRTSRTKWRRKLSQYVF